MEELIKRSYSAIVKRGLINELTQPTEFIKKLHEEYYEVIEAYYTEFNNGRYIEELIDLATVCFMQIEHLGKNPIKEFEKGVIKNEKRAGIKK